ncbi:aminotransferase-like domain-containing protein [Marinobacterium arenosum]|uniref:aminotransferase-like domain-containing protein n=1 Tax=Marinobacterium arenosum TaxID=2862496 RepID=UPI001C93C4DF|nr:PLP-dependent aminotransferase family protein [Marinobacterium arenosum]MBY4675482.1 PLP-dependent aminotransferase family protein [Marinobacterium arenosum]
MKLYEQLADTLAQRIEQGYFRSGDKLPSIRSLSQEHGVSISTVQEAYRLLEDRGLAQPRPKSGYYVSPRIEVPPLPSTSSTLHKPLRVSRWQQVLHMMSQPEDRNMVYLSVALPNLEAPTLKPLQTILSDLNRRVGLRGLAYDQLHGADELRHQVARLAVDSGCRLAAEEIIVTTGCQEALSTSLRAISQAGDIIAVDSPGFFGSLQAIEANGLQALEIPCHPETGMSLEALELALEQWPVKAILTTPTFNNPAGYCMPDSHKQRLLELARKYDLPIIEDDIYGDLSYSYPRPRTIKSFDQEGRVILCSATSKSIAPGLRVGWVAPGQYLMQVMHMKYVTSMASTTLPQLAVAEFIAQGGYERHLRKMRASYKQNRDRMLEWVARYLPEGTRASRPQGGYLLWVELPQQVDAEQLNERTQARGVSVAPGPLFSASTRFQNCIRINFAPEMNARVERALQIVGEEAQKLIDEVGKAA